MKGQLGAAGYGNGHAPQSNGHGDPGSTGDPGSAGDPRFATPTTSPKGTANILLVDDREENLLALAEILQPLGQNLVLARSGDQALKRLLADDFAVILLDVQMPGLDGFETATHIKQRERSRHIPIIFLTAISREPHHALRGYSTGAVDYLAKPFDPWVMRSKVAVFVDLYFERKRAQAAEHALLHQALHDSLTGLPNRALLIDRLSQALARRERRRLEAAVLFLDVDRFKWVNDSLGHAAGDALLVTAAGRFESVLRPGDTVARFGGDEFVVLCEDLETELEALAVAERLSDVLAAPFHLKDREIRLSASIGIALSSSRHDTPDALLRDADAAMYRAKEKGRERIELFDDDMRTRAVARLETESALRRGLERGELTVYYQPIIEFASGRAVGLEALVRWKHPERGLVQPSEFIPVAEETGLILGCGAAVLAEACTHVARWNERHPGRPPLAVSVNLSAHQLLSGGLGGLVAGALERSGLEPRLLCLEITETVLMADAGASRAALEGLKDLGVMLALDDFGTGYSSLAYLRGFPVDVLKIDRSFVLGLGESAQDTAIVASVIALAHALGLRAVAEGVETSEQAARLQELGCDLAQGYHWSVPLTARRTDHWLDARYGESLLSGPSTSRVLIVDDDRRLREVVRLALQFEGSFDVVAEAGDGAEAIEQARVHQPDLVLLDLVMPGMSGVDALPHIVAAAPGTKVVVFTAFETGAGGSPIPGAAGQVQKGRDLSVVVQQLSALMRPQG